MPYEVYKVIHLLGIMMTFAAFGGAIVRTQFDIQEKSLRVFIAIINGIGLLLVLVGGFGLLARLQISLPWPGWVIVKMALWSVFAVLTGVVNSKPAAGKALWLGILGLGGIAAFMATFKPF